MSKYCPECGAEINDEAKVCEQCGTAIETAIEKPAEDKAAKKKKILILAGVIAGAVLVVVIALVILISSIVSSFGAEGTAKKFAKAMAAENTKKMISLTSDVYKEYYEFYQEKYDVDELEEEYEQELEYVNSFFENYAGSDYKLKYEIEDVDFYSEDMLDDMYGWYEDTYDVDTDVIKESAMVEVEFQVSKDGKDYFYDVDLVMVKENNTWRVFDFY